MRGRWADDVERSLRSTACADGTHDDCPHVTGLGGGLNPVRIRIELGAVVCKCECHAECPIHVTSARMTVPVRRWREECSCPGAATERQAFASASGPEQSGDCARNAHDACPHMLHIGGGVNPLRFRPEIGASACTCECHACCPVTITDDRMTAPLRVWLESCSCPGVSRFREEMTRTKRNSRARREAGDATRAARQGKSRDEIKERYVAELRSRGLDVPR